MQRNAKVATRFARVVVRRRPPDGALELAVVLFKRLPVPLEGLVVTLNLLHRPFEVLVVTSGLFM
jgi:hypothetical protein